jgi:hypothetical protein
MYRHIAFILISLFGTSVLGNSQTKDWIQQVKVKKGDFYRIKLPATVFLREGIMLSGNPIFVATCNLSPALLGKTAVGGRTDWRDLGFPVNGDFRVESVTLNLQAP